MKAEKDKRKRDPVEVTDKEILKAYWGGVTLAQLTGFVAYNERVTKAAAKERVEHVIYEDVRRNA